MAVAPYRRAGIPTVRSGTTENNKPEFDGEWVRLGDVCAKGKSNLRQKDLKNDGPYPVYGAPGIVGFSSNYQNADAYVAVVKDGAGVGRVIACEPRSSVLGTMQALLPGKGIDRDYLLHLVRSMDLGKGFTGSTIPHIYFKDYGKTLVRALSREQQVEVANRLSGIDHLISQGKGQLSFLDDLVKSQFVEMFGDPATNSKSWKTESLTNLGSCKNGLNFKYRDNGLGISCLGVGDFKDKTVINSVNEMGFVSLDESPSDNYLLNDGDLVFVRSNGNKELVGRCVAVYPHGEKAVYSGFCIRLRLQFGYVRVPYLVHMLKQPGIRRQMFGRGANVQNLNQQLLSNIQVPLPPLTLQDQFADFVARVDKLGFDVQQQIEKLETLKQSLMQEYFG